MENKEFKVLLIYPALFMQTGLPLGVSSLVATLKKRGIDCKVFDTVFYQDSGEVDENIERAVTLHSVKAVDYNSVGMLPNSSSMEEDLSRIMAEYKPDLVGLSAIECIFERGIKLTRLAKKISNVPVIAGGVFATLAPDIVIQENSIDFVCVGEGEEVLADLCERIKNKESYLDVRGLWIKDSGKILKNKAMPLQTLDSVIEPDFFEFNPKLFYRPMQGNLFKTIPVEFARGCPYQCTYCAEPSLSRFYKASGETGYFRTKSMKRVISEIKKGMELYKPEFFYFATETFLAMSDEAFDEFYNGYKKIKLPFWIQTRIETITDERIQKLKEVGLFWLTIGIEHGNEDFRKKYLKRNMKNERIFEVMKILDRCGQGVSLNSIIGFPFETRELIFDTIMLNRKLSQINNRVRCNISIFTPFRGCELYDLCVSNGLFEPVKYTNHTNVSKGSLLKSKLLTNQELNGLFRTFNLYVYLPEEYFERIRLAQQPTDEGNKEFLFLSSKLKEYMY
ncbi:MAG: B12-binding domain-containing radical SAM protein [Candidatus Omnitrophica bacterium]|nr:B12-binding domain-containing radical SAM protein [Candidatus Omnitrophota bacterium]